MVVWSLAAMGGASVRARTGGVWERLGLGHGEVLLPLGEVAFRRWLGHLDGVLAATGAGAVRAARLESIEEVLGWELRSYRDLPRSFYMIDTGGRLSGARLDGDGDRAMAARAALEAGVAAEVERQAGAVTWADGVEGRVLIGPGRDAREVALLGCEACGHVGAREVVARRAPVRGPRVAVTDSAYETVTTPEATTVAEVARQLKVGPEAILKTMVIEVDGRTFVAVLPGNRQLNLTKIAALVGGREAKLADADVVAKLTGAPIGWAGPVGLRAPIIADFAVHDGPWVVGANEVDAHLRGVVAGVHFDRDIVGDVTFAEAGDGCPRCGDGRLTTAGGVVIGWVRGPMPRPGAKGVAGATGPIIPWLTRFELDALALFRILLGDGARPRWGRDLAPAEAVVVALDPEAADVAVHALEAAGVTVLVDDRDERAGAKLQFADDLAIEPRVVAGRRFREEGFEVRERLGAEPIRVSVTELARVVTEMRGRL